MPLTILFWGLMIAWLVLWLGGWWPIATTVLIFLLFCIVGWKNFGPPIQG